jgi:hypothetical protein
VLLSFVATGLWREEPVHRAAIITLDISAALIASGGLYDVFTPRLPANLRERCGHNEEAQTLVRALLRALGGCLVAIGIAVAVLANGPVLRGERWGLLLVLVLVVPSEGLNAAGMRRVSSPYYFPIGFILLTVAGIVLAAVGSPR